MQPRSWRSNIGKYPNAIRVFRRLTAQSPVRTYLWFERRAVGDTFILASESVMNNPVQPRRPNTRLFDGRIEKRLPTAVPVYLGSLEDPRSPERTLTENVSPHGARVLSKRSWRPGEESLITPLTGEFPQIGRVIYCLPRTGDRFCLGMEFPDRAVKWGDHSKA